MQRIIVTAGSLSEAEAALNFCESDGEPSFSEVEMPCGCAVRCYRAVVQCAVTGEPALFSLVLGSHRVCWTGRPVTACICPRCVHTHTQRKANAEDAVHALALHVGHKLAASYCVSGGLLLPCAVTYALHAQAVLQNYPQAALLTRRPRFGSCSTTMPAWFNSKVVRHHSTPALKS